MSCPHCASASTKEQTEKTALGYRTFRTPRRKDEQPSKQFGASSVLSSDASTPSWLGEVVYELFYMALSQAALTPVDMVDLYLHRGGVECVLTDEPGSRSPT